MNAISSLFFLNEYNQAEDTWKTIDKCRVLILSLTWLTYQKN